MKKLPLILNLSTYLLGKQNMLLDLCGYNTKIVDAINELGFKIIKGQLSENTENLIFSPFSVLLVISVLNYGLGDLNSKARSDLLGNLDLLSYRHKLHNLTGSFLKNLTTTINQIPGTEIDILTILQFADYLELNYQSEKELISNYNALVSKYDFSRNEERNRALNETYRLIRRHTKNQLNLFNLKYLPKESSRLNIYTTLHLNSNWLDTFNSIHTFSDKFYNLNGKIVKILYMNRVTYVNVSTIAHRDLQLVEVPLEDNKLGLILIVSSQRYSLHEMLFKIKFDELNYAIKNLNKKYINIRIPRFIIENQISVQQLLKPLKVSLAFNCKQSSLQRFSKRDRTCLDFNLLYTKMKVDEQGLNVISEDVGFYGQQKVDTVAPKLSVQSSFAFIVRDVFTGAFLQAGLINHL